MSFRPLAKANDRICNLVGSYIMAFKRRSRHLIGSCYLVAFYKMALNLEPRHLTGICYVVGFDKMASKQAICILWWLSFACDCLQWKCDKEFEHSSSESTISSLSRLEFDKE